jgi:hypothetical protein
MITTRLCRPRALLGTALGGIVLLVATCASAQERFVPLEMRAAYAKGTRSADGRPGPKYWQNGAAYHIAARLDTATHALEGREEVRYFNRSPDTLTTIILRLYPDLFRTGNARDFDLPADDIGAGMVLTHLALAGKTITAIDSLERHGTNLFVPLPAPLAPRDTLLLDAAWHYRLPTVATHRGGKYNDHTYLVTYWYPQIAVYDDIAGWDDIEYHGVLDHYDDFSDFDVRVTVPPEFVVWATGVLANPEEVLASPYLERYEAARGSDDVVGVVTRQDRATGGITRATSSLTWHFTADGVTDVAFAASNTYLWDLSSLVVDSTSRRRVAVGAAYRAGAEPYANAVTICRRTIEYLSTEVPGVPFPFPSFTAFNGTFGMEYPMMADVRAYSRPWLFYHTLSHEVAHTYFPFYVETNERKYAFMDEGWAQMLPMGIQNREIPRLNPRYDARHKNTLDYEEAAGRERTDRPPVTLSTNLDLANYHNVNYDRPGAAYYFLQDVLGGERFGKALREFIRRWHHKHPTPSDFFETLEDVLGEDLGWYWNPWFFEFGYPDLAVARIEERRDGSRVVVERRGRVPTPLQLTVAFSDGDTLRFYETARIWADGRRTHSVRLPRGKHVTEVRLGDRIIPDVDRTNNGIPGTRDR